MLVNIGKCSDNDKIIPDPWLPPKKEVDIYQNRTSRYNNQTKHSTYMNSAWENDRREKSEEWLDFLEELENRGYDLYDPEAEDIWTEFN